ncbi:MAG: thiol reductant ABC exporter subunit CydC [Anaerolineaceae bacterium]|nr:thiol reductant ABC exporter subunit CydC [Anaerolineaceae bacterium]
MKTFFNLLSFMRPFSKKVLLSILVGSATVFSAVGLLGTSAFLISKAALRPSIAELQVAIVGVRFFGLSRGVFRYLERLISHSINFQLISELRGWFYNIIEPLVPARLQIIQTGDLLARGVQDIENLEDFYVRAIAPPLTALLVTAGISLFVGNYGADYVWIFAFGMFLSGVAVPALTRLISKSAEEEQVGTLTRLNVAVLDGILGLGDLQMAGRSNEHTQNVLSISEELGKNQNKLGFYQGLAQGLHVLISNLTFLGILAIGVPMVRNSTLDGAIYAVLALIVLAGFEAVEPLGLTAQKLSSSLKSGENLLVLAEKEPEIPNILESESLKSIHTLQIKNLDFSYHDDLEPALNDINLRIAEGQKVAIMGYSGAGKSTLVNLLVRFWDYQIGEILVDGKSIKHILPEDIRGQISVVSPISYIFGGTVLQNFQIADSEISEEEVESILNSVNLTSWLHELPNGLHTWIGENGVQMSGGQRQRFIIARALLERKPFIILDEPTIHLDLHIRKEIIDLLLGVFSEKNIIWITHQTYGLTKMDEICIMKDGRIVERGTHTELLQKDGLYSGTFNPL